MSEGKKEKSRKYAAFSKELDALRDSYFEKMKAAFDNAEELRRLGGELYDAEAELEKKFGLPSLAVDTKDAKRLLKKTPEGRKILEILNAEIVREDAATALGYETKPL